MKIVTTIKGKQYQSYDKPNMGQIRIHAEMRAKALKYIDRDFQSLNKDEQKDMFNLLKEVEKTKIDLVVSAFPKIDIQTLDPMITDDFEKLYSQVAMWVTTKGTKTGGTEKNK